MMKLMMHWHAQLHQNVKRVIVFFCFFRKDIQGLENDFSHVVIFISVNLLKLNMAVVQDGYKNWLPINSTGRLRFMSTYHFFSFTVYNLHTFFFFSKLKYFTLTFFFHVEAFSVLEFCIFKCFLSFQRRLRIRIYHLNAMRFFFILFLQY